MAKKSIVWLASYPKSGNTWTRIFLANYLFKRATPMPINQVHRLGIGDAVPRAYAAVANGPFDPSDQQRALALRPRVLKGITNNDADINFVKTHNARTRAFGVELVPTELSRAVVYIIRHPLDMACSYARHYGLGLPETLEAISRSDNVIVGDAAAVPQYLGNWSDHVLSWTKQRDFPVLVLRYEDLLTYPTDGFSRLLELIGVPVEDARLERAIRFSSFDEVSRQESDKGFIEKSPAAERFFHSGVAGQWRELLSEKEAEAFCQRHASVLRAHGYL
ncbi:MAG: sulfotransferase domain-containing protein [Pseudomonadota bacterium]